ncbi:hypothetical protein [Corynebacterium riegelii]|uniref:hypothetical protein n=1 Tax=Corynebacterium riegelii TaxID=156976 RepID=UPI00288A3C10|nr:hypothetical protein [Corynebacterium riegelii]
MKTLKALTIAALAVIFTACGATQDFQDEAQKQEIFDTYICAQVIEASESLQESYANEVAMDVLADSAASEEDKKIALGVSMAYMGNDVGYDGPPLTLSPDGEACYGWVWDRYIEKQRASEVYENFTWEQAEEADIFE